MASVLALLPMMTRYATTTSPPEGSRLRPLPARFRLMEFWIIAWIGSRLSAYSGDMLGGLAIKLKVAARIGPLSTWVGVELQPTASSAARLRVRTNEYFIDEVLRSCYR